MPPSLKETLDQLDAATNKLADHVGTLSSAVDGVSTRVAALIDKLSTSMSAHDLAAAKAVLDAETSQLDAITSGLDTIASTLNQVAADKTEPVPEVPPAPELPPVTEVFPSEGSG